MHHSGKSLSHRARPFLTLFTGLVISLFMQEAARAAVIVVSSNADVGANTLRAAITSANGTAGADTINFNIGSGLQTITIGSALPTITEDVIIDGVTQPGFAGTPLIRVVPTNNYFGDCMTITASNCQIRALNIASFAGDAININGANAQNNTVVGCFIGTDATGTAASGNSTGIVIDGSSHHNTIGGTLQGTRNLISANSLYGMKLFETHHNTVLGNLIGTNAAGSGDLGNGGNGMLIDQATDNIIGGNTATARNVISGNGGAGIYINDPDTKFNTVLGNYIGTNAAGNAAIANDTGITFGGQADTNTIGGTTSAARNVISGNSFYGIVLLGSAADDNVIKANYIGLNASGTGAVPNGQEGVRIEEGPVGTIIGGTTAGERNVISGNGSHGVNMFGNGTMNNLVQGNYIGTNYAGTYALPNAGFGVTIQAGAAQNQIGSAVAGGGNLISGNGVDGIYIWNPGTNDNKVFNNFIGTNALGTGAIGNTRHGVLIEDGATGNQVGGVGASQGNRIAFNKQNGVTLTSFAAGNPIRGNSIFSNLKLGIDLENNGVSANDAQDPDTGANDIQNYPSVTSVSQSGGNTSVTGAFNSTPSSTFNLDLYRSVTPDPSGFGEGEIYVGSLVVTTNASGDLAAPYLLTIPGSFATQYFSVTATNAAGSTSEFSRVYYSITGRITTSGNLGIGGITVTRNGGNTVTTNSSGYFTFYKVPAGSHLIKPTSVSYIYAPATRTVSVSTADVVGQNFIAYPAGAYTITGRTATTGGIAIANVVIKTTGRPDVLSNGAGYYTVPSLPNGNYTVTPVLAPNSWTPASRSVTINGANSTNQNFTGYTGYTVSGRVQTSGGVGIGSVAVKLDANGPTVLTNSSGYFTHTNVPNGNHTLTPTKAGLVFSPASKNITVAGANLINQNFIGS